MTAKRQTICIIVFAWAQVMVLSVGTQGVAQDHYLKHCSKLPNEMTRQLTDQSIKAKRIGNERYQFSKRLADKFGFIVGSMPESSCTVLFPLGRSDRAYILQQNDFSQDGTSKSLISCYQRKDGKDKFVYSVKLKISALSLRRVTRIKSLLDDLNARDCVVRGVISEFAKKDLAMERDYVEYKYQMEIETLEVFTFSDLKHGWPPRDIETYALGDADPNHPDKFFREYGFPVAKGER